MQNSRFLKETEVLPLSNESIGSSLLPLTSNIYSFIRSSTVFEFELF